MAAKTLTYKDEDGKEYKISFSEELQMKNLRAARENTQWLRKNFYAKIVLILIILAVTTTFIYMLYRLDAINFFTTLLYKR
ncbi:hypothetical protein HYX18_04810 [Candidatus Woesearchaeota archaeon]|nr:hypothetical protein [Candidatus Woesearchaeota archaeon]